MKKINVDIKNGQFTIYPSREDRTSLEGYISKAYYRKVGIENRYQLKVVLINNNEEYTLNVIPGNITYQSLVTTLIENTEDKVNLIIEKETSSFGDYYLVKNKQL